MNTDDAYIAGFFDGEGCVYQSPRGRLVVQISQKDPSILLWIIEYLGYGRLVSTKSRNVHDLRIYRHDDILSFANVVLPYSHVKAKALSAMCSEIRRRQRRSPALYGRNRGTG